MKSIFRAAILALCLTLGLTAAAQQRQQRPNPVDGIKAVADRIYNYLNGCTPYTLEDAKGKPVTDLSKIDNTTTMSRGDFSITSYEWGVTYSGMLALNEVLGDEKYSNYVFDRFNALGEMFPYQKKY